MVRSLVLLATASAEMVNLTIMTYNTMQFPTLLQDLPGDPFAWEQQTRAKYLAGAIRSLDPLPDVIGFQEIMNDYAKEAIKELQNDFPYHTPVLGDECDGIEGIWNAIVGECGAVKLTDSGVMLIR